MTGQHTPLVVSPLYAGQYNIIRAGDSVNPPIALVYDKDYARLFSAAPELLEACKAMMAYQRAVESNDTATGLLDAYVAAFEGASEAARKATGESS